VNAENLAVGGFCLGAQEVRAKRLGKKQVEYVQLKDQACTCTYTYLVQTQYPFFLFPLSTKTLKQLSFLLHYQHQDNLLASCYYCGFIGSSLNSVIPHPDDRLVTPKLFHWSPCLQKSNIF
jgi:hypothetical protein